MSLSNLSIRNPVFAVMLSAAMIVFGYLGYRDMGVRQFPEIDFPEKEFKQQIAAIPEVGGVQFAGLQARNIRVWVDRDKLTSFNLAADDVKKAIQDQHAELPAGYIKSHRVEFNLRTMGEAYTV